jgi:hypothetical protein
MSRICCPFCAGVLTPVWCSFAGHTLVVDDDGDFTIAQPTEDGSLIASAIKFVGRSAPDGTPSNLIPHLKKDCHKEICSELQEREFHIRSSPECENDEEHEDCETVVRRKLSHSVHRRTTTATTGYVKNLVIPFKFSDHATRTLPSQSDLNILFNGSDEECQTKQTYCSGNSDCQAICDKSGSVRKFYNVDSYGNLDMESVVVDWVPISMTEAEAANGNSG